MSDARGEDGLDPFPDEVPFNEAMRAGITACNGFVYEGGDMEAQIRFVKWMRTHPHAAAVLMADYSGRSGGPDD